MPGSVGRPVVDVLRWSCGDPVKPGETYLVHVKRCLARPHWKCMAAGAWRETLLLVDSWAILLCECGELLQIECEHSKGMWPNNKSVCEWLDDDHLICTRCGLDCT